MNIKNKLSRGYWQLIDMLETGGWAMISAIAILLGTSGVLGIILMSTLYFLGSIDIFGVILLVFGFFSVVYWVIILISHE